MSHPVAARAAYQIDTGSNWCQSEATQQKSKSIPSLGAIHWLLTHCCDGARSQGVLRVRIAEVFRTKQTKIVKGGLCTIWPYQGKKSPITHLSISQILPRAWFQQGRASGSQEDGDVDLLWRRSHSSGKWGMDRLPADFHSPFLYGYLFLALVLWAWGPRLGLKPHTFRGKKLQLRYPSAIWTAALGIWSSSFSNSALLTSLVACSVNSWF